MGVAHRRMGHAEVLHARWQVLVRRLQERAYKKVFVGSSKAGGKGFSGCLI